MLATTPVKWMIAIVETNTAIGAAIVMNHFSFLANRIIPASTYIHAVDPHPHTITGIPKRNSQLRIGSLNKDTNHTAPNAKTIANAPDQ